MSSLFRYLLPLLSQTHARRQTCPNCLSQPDNITISKIKVEAPWDCYKTDGFHDDFDYLYTVFQRFRKSSNNFDIKKLGKSSTALAVFSNYLNGFLAEHSSIVQQLVTAGRDPLLQQVSQMFSTAGATHFVSEENLVCPFAYLVAAAALHSLKVMFGVEFEHSLHFELLRVFDYEQAESIFKERHGNAMLDEYYHQVDLVNSSFKKPKFKAPIWAFEFYESSRWGLLNFPGTSLIDLTLLMENSKHNKLVKVQQPKDWAFAYASQLEFHSRRFHVRRGEQKPERQLNMVAFGMHTGSMFELAFSFASAMNSSFRWVLSFLFF